MTTSACAPKKRLPAKILIGASAAIGAAALGAWMFFKLSGENYMGNADMARAMQIFRETLGADARVISLQFFSDTAKAHLPDRGRVEIMDGKAVRYEGSGTQGLPGAVLSAFDPKAARDRIVALSDCPTPSRMTIATTANGRQLTHLLCAADTPQAVKYTMGDQGALLPELDLKSADGVAAAWEEMRRILPPDLRIWMWGLTFDEPGGRLFVLGEGFGTTRYGTRAGHDNVLLTQNYVGEKEPPPSDVRVGDISPEGIRKGHRAAEEKCGAGSIEVVAMQRKLAYMSFMTKEGCGVQVGFDGTPR